MKLPALVLLLAGSLGAVPLTLQQALDEATKQSPDIQLARLRTAEAEARIAVVRAGLMPQATLQIAGTYQTSNLQGIGLVFPGFPSRVGPYRTFDSRPRVTQSVLDFQLLSSIRTARARVGVASTQAEAVKEDLLVAVATAYFQALEAEARVAAAEARLTTAEAILHQARDREATAIGSKLDIARAEQQAETERGLVLQAQQDTDTIKSLLLQLIGRPQTALELTRPAEPNETRDATALLAEAIAKRPGLRALRQDLEVSRLEVETARREKLPKLTAFGDWGIAGAGPDRALSTYAVGAALTIPLWTGRRIEAEMALAAVRTDQVNAQLRKVQLEIEQQLRQALIERDSARAQLQAAERARAAAAQSLDLARVRLETGLATTVDVQVAQESVATADDTAIRSRFAVSLASTRLAWAAGDVRRAFR